MNGPRIEPKATAATGPGRKSVGSLDEKLGHEYPFGPYWARAEKTKMASFKNRRYSTNRGLKAARH
jgi:hypothetical protein